MTETDVVTVTNPTIPALENEYVIECNEVNKWFGDFHVLKGITLNVKSGEVIVILGPSGSGKSTFIRCLNRLEEHQQGDIIIDGITLSHDVRNIAEIRREVGYGVPTVQLVPTLNGVGKCHLGTHSCAQMVTGKSGRDRDEMAHPCWHS